MVFWLLQVPLFFMIVSLRDVPMLAAVLLTLSFMLAFAAAENMLVARYTPFRWRALAYGAKFVLALGVGGVTVHLAGWLFDNDGDFGFLFSLFGSAGLLAAGAAFFLPRNRRRAAIVTGAE
jgi:FSR family fosmidomycin resistance protein-like MFS transporter